MTMKMSFLKRKPIQLFVGAALVLSTLFVSCDKNDDDNMNDQTYTVSGNSSGTQMNPSNTSTASGTMTGTYNARTNVLNYNIGWNTLTTAAGLVQVYSGASGVNGTLLFPISITTPGTTGTASGSVTLTDSQETEFLAGNTYYTISSTTYPGGEIRGQITATAN